MATPTRNPHEDENSVFGSLFVPVVLVAIVALVGWALFAFAKGIVVAIAYAVGVALVVVTALLTPRLLRGRTGRARWRRIGSLVAAVALGALLIVAAHEISRRGWLLVAIPAAVVAIWALLGRVRGR